MKISIQAEDFDIREECDLLQARGGAGAIVTFTGLVRDYHGGAKVSGLFLEHYPGMTEKSLAEIVDQAGRRWPIIDATIIHRVGELKADERIVLVAASSAHRQDAFEACAFMMDYLKTRAPFWKKSRGERGEHWVQAKESDREAASEWDRQGGAG